MNSGRSTIKLTLIVVVILLLTGYILFQSKNLILGPMISIDEPKNGSTLNYEVVTVKGKAKNIAYIYLNDRQIFVDNLGNFKEKLVAPLGYSLIKLAVKDKFGRVKEKVVEIIVEKEGGSVTYEY